MKAKSRLARHKKKKLSDSGRLTANSYTKSPSRKGDRQLGRSWLWLILAIFFYGGGLYLLTQVQPQTIANLPLPQAYLPLHLILLPANWLLLAFLLKSLLRGLVLATAVQLILFLYLQDVIITPLLLITVLGGGLLLTFLLRFVGNPTRT